MVPKLKSKIAFSVILFVGLFMLFQMVVFLFHHIGMHISHVMEMQSILPLTSEHSVVGLVLSSIFIVVLSRMFWQIGKQINLFFIKYRKDFSKNQDIQATIELNKKYPSFKNNIIVVKNDQLFAMTFGFIKPRIAISNAWQTHFTIEEIESVLLHEHFHCRNRDPLKFLIIRILLEGIAYIPILTSVVHYYKTWRELLADQYAMKKNEHGTSLRFCFAQTKSAYIKRSKNKIHFVKLQHISLIMPYIIAFNKLFHLSKKIHVPLAKHQRFALSVFFLFVVNVLVFFVSCVDKGFVLHKFLY